MIINSRNFELVEVSSSKKKGAGMVWSDMLAVFGVAFVNKHSGFLADDQLLSVFCVLCFLAFKSVYFIGGKLIGKYAILFKSYIFGRIVWFIFCCYI